jgi:hypothetical protein
MHAVIIGHVCSVSLNHVVDLPWPFASYGSAMFTVCTVNRLFGD